MEENLELKLSSTIHQANTLANYQLAQNYYRQRRQILVRNFLRQYNMDLENFAEIITKEIQKAWLTFTEQAVNLLSEDPKKAQAFIEEWMEQNRISMKLGEITDKNKSTKFGTLFEIFVGEKIKQHLSGVLSQVTGGLTSKRAIFGDKTENRGTFIRPDVIIGMESRISHTDKDDGYLYVRENGDKISVELTNVIELQDSYGSDGTHLNEASLPSALNAYLTETTTAFGLNLKQWISTSSGKTITKNSALKKMINAQIDRDYDNGYPWEHDYAKIYSTYIISKYLFGLLGPLNAAMVNGDLWMWMDDWLDTHILEYQIAIRKDTESDPTRAFYIRKGDIVERTLNDKLQDRIDKNYTTIIDIKSQMQ